VRTDWHTAYQKTIGAHTPVDTEAKNDERKAAAAVTRPFTTQYLMFPPVTNEDRTAMGVHNKEKLRDYADRHHDTRKYLGAIAGVVFGEGVKPYALSRGFYVLEPSGDTFAITEPKGEYYPHEW
jgi:hypothetical protein